MDLAASVAMLRRDLRVACARELRRVAKMWQKKHVSAKFQTMLVRDKNKTSMEND